MKKGLDKAAVIEAAAQMIEEEGRHHFSLHKLADRLGVRTASLYNHVSSLEDLMTGVSVLAIRRLIEAEKEAIQGRSGDEAVRALAGAYRCFGAEHYELYQIFMESRKPHNEVLESEGVHILDPIMQAFAEYSLTDTEKVHGQRILRSILHGFITQEKAGFFTSPGVSEETSFQEAIQCFLTWIHQVEGEKSHES